MIFYSMSILQHNVTYTDITDTKYFIMCYILLKIKNYFYYSCHKFWKDLSLQMLPHPLSEVIAPLDSSLSKSQAFKSHDKKYSVSALKAGLSSLLPEVSTVSQNIVF